MPDYGLWQEKDLALDALAAEVDRDSLLDAQRETLATANQQVGAFVDLFANRVTSSQLSVRGGVNNRLQGLDENGRPKPVKGASRYIVGLPIWKAGTAEGWNFWTYEQMTVQEFAQSLDTMLTGYVTWMRDQLLSPFFYSGAGLSYANANDGESFTVYGLANGDATTFESSAGAATDSHYSAQAGVVDASANPYPAIYEDMIEHPQNTGRIVAFVPPGAIATATKLLPGFASATDPIIRIVPAAADETVDPLVAPALGVPLPRSMTYLGVIDNTYVVQWRNLPDGYILHVAIDAEEKPLAMRQYPQARLQGLRNIGEPMSQFPYQQTNYVVACGFGSRNRVGAHVHRVGNGTYAAPTAFPFPMI